MAAAELYPLITLLFALLYGYITGLLASAELCNVRISWGLDLFLIFQKQCENAQTNSAYQSLRCHPNTVHQTHNLPSESAQRALNHSRRRKEGSHKAWEDQS